MRDKKLYSNLTNDLIEILRTVKTKIGVDSDCDWSYYESPLDAHREIDKYISELQNGDLSSLDEIKMHFAPTSAYQELSMQNNWSEEYLKLADKFDLIESKLSNFS